MDWLVTHEGVIALAVLGAVLSVAASVLQVRGAIGPQRARQLNRAGYACMALSMALFVFLGFRGRT